MKRQVTHWVHKHWFKRPSVYVFCGLIRKFVARKYTTHRNKVTCGNCIRLMKLHGHLEDES